LNPALGSGARQYVGERTMTDAVADVFRLSDVFGQAATIYRRRFLLFLTLMLMPYTPVYLFELFIWRRDFVIGWQSLFLLLHLICSPIASAAVICGAVLELRGRAPSLVDSIELASRRILPMLGAAISTGFLACLASVLLVVPGLMVLCAYYVTIPACIAEQGGVFTSMSRSTHLTKGHRWQILGVFLLLTIGDFAVRWIAIHLGRAAGALGVLIGWHATGAIVSAFSAVIASVVYYQLRVAKDGTDIDKIVGVFD
jgi:hypothetical protein